MRKDRGALLFLAHFGMELSWLYAWVTFLMTSIVHRPFPLPEAIGTSLLAAALSRVVRGMGLRVIWVLGLQILGFLLAASRIVYTFYYPAYPYFGKGWLAEFLIRTRDPMAWLILVIVLIFALLFWLGGVTLARRSTAYFTICGRFDLGVAAFFCLLLVKFLLLVKGGIDVKDPSPELLLFPFFIFSLLAIGLARNSSSVRRDFLAGYRGVGVLVSFTMVVLAFGAGLVLLFMPYLSAAAEAGYGVLKSAAEPLSPILVRVLRFIFFGSRLPQESSSSSYEPEPISSGESSWWSEVVVKVLEWGLLGLGALMGIILCALGAWYLLRWLFSRTSKKERKHIHWQLALLWAQRLWAALAMGLQRAVQWLKGYRDAVQIYRALRKWGRRSGLPHLLSETPVEYGSRLRMQFPSLTGEIGGIVEAFNLVVYGEVALDDDQMTLVKLFWRRLRSPRYWPARVKSWFLQANERLTANEVQPSLRSTKRF
ncbi:MAG: DUF4129 domain-containing protein [Desulfobacteraceae bacterium]|jgi:hypothetical protein